MQKKLWMASPEKQQQSQIYRFRQFAEARYHRTLSDYSQLYRWSVEQPEEFWSAAWDFFDIVCSAHFTTAVENVESFRDVKWFRGATLNYTENMLRFCDSDKPAIIFRGENQLRREISSAQLKDETLRMAQALRREGVKEGDVVAAYMPNLPETIIAMFATAAIGAIWCSCATDIGPGAAVDRIGQVRPVVLFTADGYYYKGKSFDILANAAQLVRGIPSIRKTVVTHYAGDMAQMRAIPNSVSWENMIQAESSADFVYPHFSFEHPLVIMFSSGTTGMPKCMVQSAMGLLLNQLKELILHSDLGADDRLLYITTCSWMMWNWQAAAIGTGATLVLYDGNPSYPDNAAIWKILEQERVTVFGLSASYIHALLNAGFSAKDSADLSALREISQTGSALSSEGFDYVYEQIKKDLFFNSIAGGTDINGCFSIASLLKPIYSDELQAAGLGMKIECFSPDAKPLRDEQGELVCLMPVPSMPLYFWNDSDGSRYHNAYFDVFPNVWRHGDYVQFNSATGGISYYGRSDSVLKPSGVRIGTAEIYNQVNCLPEVEDSLAIGQDFRGDQRIILFVKLNDGFAFDDALKKKINTTLRTKASPRHVPALIFEAPDIPHTLNGKKVESAVTNILNHRAVTNRDALGNPDSLAFFEAIREELS